VAFPSSEKTRAGEIKARLDDREWRLDHLYSIQDESGRTIPFVRNEAQLAFWRELWTCNIILKARQLGFSTMICIMDLDECLFAPGTSAGIIDLTVADAKKKLEKIKFAYDNLPGWLKMQIPLAKSNTEEMVFANGSSVQVGTSHRGGTLQSLHVSEFGKIAAQFPDKAREIKTGAFGTVHAGQFIFVESTAEGVGGEFFEMVERAKALAQTRQPLTPLDFRLHFFPWWKRTGYRIDPRQVLIERELDDYFGDLKGQNVELDANQRAWYAVKLRQLGRDDMFREYPSVPEEAFLSSVDGAYFKQQMSKAREKGRIGDVPHDPSRKVNTFWDIGVGDATGIWFHQSDGVRHRLIDYYENSGEGVAHYAAVLRERKERLGYLYATHYAPHDVDNREWSSDARSRVEVAEELGIGFQVVPRISHKDDAIEAARNFLNACWIDEKYCARGIQCLDNYRKEWDPARGVWRQKPRHDWASHGADALMTGAVGFDGGDIDDKPVDRYRRKKDKRSSTWAA